MERERVLDRRRFTAEAALAALAGVAITISGCGGGSYSAPSSPSTPAPGTGGVSGSSDESGAISDNHGHVAVVTGAQIVAANAVQLDIRGTADHTHTVTLTAAAMQAIKAGQPVATGSTSSSGHDHTVTFNSDSPEPPSHY